MKFLLDTNFLLIPVNFKVDIFKELEKFGKPELYTLDLVLRELEKLAAGKGRDGKAARLALLLVKEKGVKILESLEKETDRELEKLAGKGFVVCTLDKRLSERLKIRGLKFIYLRQKKILAERV